MSRAPFTVYKLDITTLGPIHIGCGDEMDPTNYIVDDQILYQIPRYRLPHILDETDRDELLQLVDKPHDHTVSRVLHFFCNNCKDTLIANAARAIPVAAGFASLYQDRIKGNLKVDAQNKLEISRSFNDPLTQAAILPGSSLKGAIRTALLDWYRREKEYNPPGFQEDWEAKKNLQKHLFEYKQFAQDPMRLVHLADAVTAAGSEDGLTGDTRVMFAVNCGKQKNSMPRQSGEGRLYQTLETIPGLRRRAFEGQLVVHHGLAEGHRSQPILRIEMPQIADACNDFYRSRFEQDCHELRECELLDSEWYDAVQQLLGSAIGDGLANQRAFLLRVGHHSGAESLTLNELRWIEIRRRNSPSEFKNHATTWWLASEHHQRQPGERLQPFGWALVEISEMDKQPQPWPITLDRAFPAPSVESQPWRAKALQRREEALEECKQALERREELRQQLALEHERKAREEAERQRKAHEEEEQQRKAREEESQRLASLSAEQRLLEECRHFFEDCQARGGDALRRGGPIDARASGLLRTASSWPEDKIEERRAAATLLEETYKIIGYPSGKKGRARKQQLSELREGSVA